MTVSSATTVGGPYVTNGATVTYTVPFRFLEATHLSVVRTTIATGVQVTLTLNTDYTVLGAGASAGGSITTTVAYATGYQITITRNVPVTQLTDYLANDPFPAESHESALDKLTMIDQQVGYQQVLVAAQVAALTTLINSITSSLAITYPNSLRLHAWAVACSARTSILAVATKVGRFVIPYGFTVVGVSCDLGTAQTSGSIFTVNCKKNGVSILSTKLTLDNTEKTSQTAAIPAVLLTTALAAGDEITWDIDQVGDGTARWLQCTLWGYQT